MSTLLHLQQAAFSYGRKPIFRAIDLKIAAGEVVSLLGPNGCGKTTLLRCLSGEMSLQNGRNDLCGKNIAVCSETEKARKIGFVFQDHHIQFPYTVRQVVEMGRAPYLSLFSQPGKRDAAIVQEALEMVGIGHLAGERFTEISGGERQLALIARALAQEPAILLLDEPASHLDFGNQMVVLQIVYDLSRTKQLAVVMSTHFPEHALLVSDRVCLMNGGCFTAEGPPHEVLNQENLQALYNTEVKIVEASDNGDRVIVPVLRTAYRKKEGKDG